MALTLLEMRENSRKARETMQRARTEYFALGAFNIDNQETLIAVVRAAKKFNAPVLIEVSKGEVDALGLFNIRDMVDNYKHEYGVEIYINLDHSPTVEDAIAGIEAGYEFIHIDVSQANHEASNKEIIKATSKVVNYALLTGAIVESEPHYFQGSSNVHKETIDYKKIKKTFTKPTQAKEFVKYTGIDTFAAAIGNLHGKYPVPKILDIELLKKIRKTLPAHINVSLHGGSGTPEKFYIEAVRNGVTKVNINSDMRYAFRTKMEQVLKDNPDEFAVVKLMDQVKDTVQEVVESKIQAFNAKGKARP